MPRTRPGVTAKTRSQAFVEPIRQIKTYHGGHSSLRHGLGFSQPDRIDSFSTGVNSRKFQPRWQKHRQQQATRADLDTNGQKGCRRRQDSKTGPGDEASISMPHLAVRAEIMGEHCISRYSNASMAFSAAFGMGKQGGGKFHGSFSVI